MAQHQRLAHECVVARTQPLDFVELVVDRHGGVVLAGQRGVAVAAVADGQHATTRAAGDELDGDVGEGLAHEDVDHVRLAGAQVIGQIGVDGINARAAL